MLMKDLMFHEIIIYEVVQVLAIRCKGNHYHTEDMIKEMEPLVFKEDDKSKKLLTQSIQELWDILKKPNLRIIDIEEGEETQLRNLENIFNKSQKKIFLI